MMPVVFVGAIAVMMLVFIGVAIVAMMVLVFVRVAIVAVVVLMLAVVTVVAVMMFVLVGVTVLPVMVLVLVRVIFSGDSTGRQGACEKNGKREYGKGGSGFHGRNLLLSGWKSLNIGERREIVNQEKSNAPG